MTSKETKKQRLNEARLKRARALVGVDPFDKNTEPPKGSVMADQKELAHNNTYGPLPIFYIDKIVVCRICGNDASKCYEKALKIVPKNLALWNNLTLHYKSLGKLKKALQACDNFIQYCSKTDRRIDMARQMKQEIVSILES